MLNFMGATDKGEYRQRNEDRFAGEVFACDLAYGVICDGMGGENAGAAASGIACEEFRRIMENSSHREMSERSARGLLESAVQTANTVVFEKALANPQAMGGMGTTLCAALVCGKSAYLINVGDSRAYLLRGDMLTQLTTDHTLVQVLVAQGEITEDEAKTHRKRHYLTRAVGVEKEIAADFTVCELQEEDILLLCSDGLYNMIGEAQLPELIRRAAAAQSAAPLIEAANAAGGEDNITAILILLQKEV